MGGQIAGLLSLVALPALMVLHVPAGLALAIVAVLGALLISVGQEAGFIAAATVFLYQSVEQRVMSTAILVLPVIVLLGNVTFYSGTTTRIYDGAVGWFSRIPGGIAMAAVLGSAAFSAFAGSSTASATTMGRISIPEMLRAGYDPRLATGSVAAGGLAGALLPSSLMLAMIALATGEGVGPVLVAGMVPAVLTLIALVLVIGRWAATDPKAAPIPAHPQAERPAHSALPAVGLFGMFIVGLFAGLPPALVIGLGVIVASCVGLARHWLSLDVLGHALREAVVQTVKVCAALVGLIMFLGMMSLSGLPAGVTDWAQGARIAPTVLLVLYGLVGILLAMFIEPVAVVAMLLPFLLALSEFFGFQTLWLAIILVMVIEIGLIAPPAGLNGFVIDSVTHGASRHQVFAGTARLLPPVLVVLLLLILFPPISTFLPAIAR